MKKAKPNNATALINEVIPLLLNFSLEPIPPFSQNTSEGSAA